jgi:hypothetical protein
MLVTGVCVYALERRTVHLPGTESRGLSIESTGNVALELAAELTQGLGEGERNRRQHIRH